SPDPPAARGAVSEPIPTRRRRAGGRRWYIGGGDRNRGRAGRSQNDTCRTLDRRCAADLLRLRRKDLLVLREPGRVGANANWPPDEAAGAHPRGAVDPA